MDTEFTDEQIKDLVEIDRQMDSGEVPYIVHIGYRYAMPKEIMEQFNLKSGQRVSPVIGTALLKACLSHVQAKILEQDKKAVHDLKPKDFGENI